MTGEDSMAKADRRRYAMAELVLGVAGSFAVTDPGNEDEIAAKYALTPDDMAAVKETIGARLEAWAVRLGYGDHPDEAVKPLCGKATGKAAK